MTTVPCNIEMRLAVLNDITRTEYIKKETLWVEKVTLNGCGYCCYGQLQNAQFVCALLEIRTDINSSCGRFHPGPLRIYKDSSTEGL